MAVEVTVSPGLDRWPPLRLGAAKANAATLASCDSSLFFFPPPGHLIPVPSSRPPDHLHLPTTRGERAFGRLLAPEITTTADLPQLISHFAFTPSASDQLSYPPWMGQETRNHEMTQTTRPNQDQTVLRWMASCGALIQL